MTQVAPTSDYESVKAAIVNFGKVQQKWREYGAEDTEPRNIFANILERLLEYDEDAAVPSTGDEWELYASSMDCAAAAKELHDAATTVVQLINACPTSELRKVRKYVNDYWGW